MNILRYLHLKNSLIRSLIVAMTLVGASHATPEQLFEGILAYGDIVSQSFDHLNTYAEQKYDSPPYVSVTLTGGDPFMDFYGANCSGDVAYDHDPVKVNAPAKYGTAAFNTSSLSCYSWGDPPDEVSLNNVEVTIECGFNKQEHTHTHSVANDRMQTPEGTTTEHRTSNMADASCTASVAGIEYDDLGGFLMTERSTNPLPY